MSDPQPAKPNLTVELEKTALFSPADSAARLVNVLDQYLADLQAGKTPDRSQLLADHPELARELSDCLAGIEFVHQAAAPKGGMPAQLGDFRIIGEVGRGGMGVVYEAEQLSLKRRVALKVLRFGVTADADVMQRFQREAETVAHLHHTNIVPIHAVGCEQGVHYYAMQFIEGRSLSAMLDELGRDHSVRQPADFREIADWILQAAEALAYAHQRGVIHRDIKPSNLILDPEGTVWLTDFGLAKRADEVTLTAAGILMGTPRYMSPEQAAAAQQPVDHRTDIYSLGATLYELITGKPVFEGTTPQGVITQILNAEPVAPRTLQGTLPRDLETIILKCLAKDPAQRYQQARDLADDLRAYLDNRPIRARRATLQERVVRWVRKNQRSTAVSAVTAAASLLLIIGGWTGWQLYEESRQGRLLFTTDGPTLVAEILNPAGELIRSSFPVPNPEPIIVPAGPYQIRFSGPGMLSETWQFDVERGTQQTFPIKLIDRQIGSPLNIPGVEAPLVIELDGKIHIVHHTEQGWRLIDGETLRPLWTADVNKIVTPAERDLYPKSYIADGDVALLHVNNPWSSTGTTAGLAQPATDVDRDGKQDLIFASRVSPSLLAVSAATGQILWWYRAAPPLPVDLAQEILDHKSSAESAGAIGQPLVTMLNGESVVIACFVSMQSHLRTVDGKEYLPGQKIFVDVISARTGTRIWRAYLDLPEFAQKQLHEIVRVFPTGPVVRALSGRPTAFLQVGKRLQAWDLESGKPCWQPYELTEPAAQEAQYSDLDGDGNPEALLVCLKGNRDELTLKTISLKTGQPLWEHDCLTTSQQSDWHATGELAWIVDLDRDGRGEVVVPVRDNWSQWGRHWYGIELLDGSTGKPRWTQHLKMLGQFSGSGLSTPVRMISGPDLNGDQVADLFVLSSSSPVDSRVDSPSFQLDALSGQDGQRFWRQRHPLSTLQASAPSTSTGLRWWQAGRDGWPQLIVPVAQGVGGQPISYVFAASTGRLVHTLPEVSEPQVADFNNDGINDIWYMKRSQQNQQMIVLKGMPPVNWRRPGVWRSAGDFDGDQTIDFVELRSGQIEGRSGRDGHSLWKVGLARTGPVALIDLDHDGTDDVVVMENASRERRRLDTVVYESAVVIAGFSGRTGKRIWANPDCDLRAGSMTLTGGYDDEQYSIPMLAGLDLNGDGHQEVLIAADFGEKNELHLAAFSSDQKLLWKVPLDEQCLKGRAVFERMFHDLNGDGVLDVIVSAPGSRDPRHANSTVAGLQAHDGRDGHLLWNADVPNKFPSSMLRRTHPVVGDIDGDGTPEVTVASRDVQGFDSSSGIASCALMVLDGRTGQRKWSWFWKTDGETPIWPPVLARLDAGGTRSVCLGIREVPQNDAHIIVLDHLGNLRRKIPISQVDLMGSLWGRDLDGDGRDELIFRNQDALQAYREHDQSILWKQPAIGNWYGLIKPRAATDGGLTFRYGDGPAIGLDAASGGIRWRFEPLSHSGQAMRAELITPSEPHRFPASISVDARDESSLEQSIWPTESSGRFRIPAAKPITTGAFDDLDRFRPLPWVPPMRDAISQFKTIERTDLIICLFLASVVVVRSVVWMRQNRWRLAFLYFGAVLLTSLVLAVAMLLANASRLGPHETYSWSGWAWILPSGVMAVGSLTVIVTLFGWGIKRIRTWWNPTGASQP